MIMMFRRVSVVKEKKKFSIIWKFTIQTLINTFEMKFTWKNVYIESNVVPKMTGDCSKKYSHAANCNMIEPSEGGIKRL